MAVASLSNFTVPLSNNQSADNQGLLMPKLKYRFRATFVNFGTTNPTTALQISYDASGIWATDNTKSNLLHIK